MMFLLWAAVLAVSTVIGTAIGIKLGNWISDRLGW